LPQGDHAVESAEGRQDLHILMAVRNGAAHLDAQMASLAAQDHADWCLWVRDDGSGDASRERLTAFAAAHPGRVPLDLGTPPGPGSGSAAGFLRLLANPDRPAGPVAFADQDDVWLPHKTARALAALAAVPQGHPAVYASRTWLTDAALHNRRISVTHPRGPSFGNALVQNILPGNTIVLNAAAAALLTQAGPVPVAHHYWWVYLAMTAVGARVICDPEPGLLYRQHEANAMGAHRGIGPVLTRAAMLRDRVYSGWIDTHLAALQSAGLPIPAPERALLTAFAALRRRPGGWSRLRALRRLGIARQTPAGDAALAALALTGRL
jgi:hypothetical protein